jgi:MFS family permease
LTTLTDALASDVAKRGQGTRVVSRYALAQDLGAAAGPLLGYWVSGIGVPLMVLYVLGSLSFLVLAWRWQRATQKALSW